MFQICVELDALAVIHLLKIANANCSLEPLLADCRDMLKSFPNLQIEHTYKEPNWCADVLARLGKASKEAFVLFINPPRLWWISHASLIESELFV